MKSCTQCGKCCINYGGGGLAIDSEEIEQWELFRPDIATYVQHGKIWFDPETKQALTRCPWLREAPVVRANVQTSIYSCDIYFDRPQDCRYYPVSIDEMVRDECEMLEVADLKHPKKAQLALDKLMEDSRPALE